ncbi:hypothetical protein, partial [Pseudomonas aeruginosa]
SSSWGSWNEQAAMATSRRFFSMPPMVATVERGGYGKGFNDCGNRPAPSSGQTLAHEWRWSDF